MSHEWPRGGVAEADRQTDRKRPAAAHASRLDSFCGFPIPRQQSIESIDRMPVDHALEHVMQVSVGFDVVQFSSLCRPPNYAEHSGFPQHFS